MKFTEFCIDLCKRYASTNLVVRIVCGIVAGIIFAFLMPKFTWIGTFGALFVGALKAIAPILVFILVISSLSLGSKKADGRFRTVIFFYLLSTLLAAFAAVAVSYIFPQTLVLRTEDMAGQTIPTSIGYVLSRLLVDMVANPISSLTEGKYLGILFWAIISGLALRNIASDSTKTMLIDFANCISKVVKWIIDIAPIGIMGLVFTTVSNHGLDIFTDYGKMVLALAGCMTFVFFILNPLIVFCALRTNPYPLIFKCFKDSGITAFFTRSSAANIPMNMALCEKLGLDKDMYSVSIPLGATINMNGAAVTITIMTLAAVHTLGIPVHIVTALCLSILATLAACGASGIAGGSLLLIPLACSLFGISNDIAIQVVGVGFIIGVIQDSFETALNSASDVIFTATSEFMQWKRQGKELPNISEL